MILKKTLVIMLALKTMTTFRRWNNYLFQSLPVSYTGFAIEFTEKDKIINADLFLHFAASI